jgi:hypothetical protein
METTFLLDKLKKYAGQIDRNLLDQYEMDYSVGIMLRSVVLKMQKKSWLNPLATAHPFKESIFFSIWINDEAIQEKKLHYNIHAFRLRELKNYSIKSREFAAAFRTKFKTFENKWPNVNLNFGPLTLMEGWVNIDINNFEKEIVLLAHQFLELHPIIDDLLLERKKIPK